MAQTLASAGAKIGGGEIALPPYGYAFVALDAHETVLREAAQAEAD
jgi:hypothetical protein